MSVGSKFHSLAVCTEKDVRTVGSFMNQVGPVYIGGSFWNGRCKVGLLGRSVHFRGRYGGQCKNLQRYVSGNKCEN